MQSRTTPLPEGMSTSLRALFMPALGAALLLVIGLASSQLAWKRNVLAAAFLLYYAIVVVYGIHRANLTADELFEGNVSPEEKASRAARAFQFHLSAWVTGAVALVAAFFTAMMKDRWDMPVPAPYLQIASGILWSILSATLLQLFALYRRLQYAEVRSSGTYALRGFLLYGSAALCFPIYFFLYAGQSKQITLPWLIYFSLPTNFVLAFLVLRFLRRVRELAGADSDLLLGPERQRPMVRLVQATVLVMGLCVLVGIDYGRSLTGLWVFAVRTDSTVLFRLLRPFGVDQSKRDSYGYTPLHYAVQDDSRAFVEYALGAGADREALNNFDQTPLMLAVLLDRREIAGILLKAGTDPGRAGFRGQTPLMLSARDGHVRLTELLLTARAPLNPVDAFGESALSYAVTGGHAEIADMLLRARADAALRTARFSSGDRPRSLLTAATELGHTKTVEVLRRHGVR